MSHAFSTLLLYRDGFFHVFAERPNLLEVYELSRSGLVLHHALHWGRAGLDPLN